MATGKIVDFGGIQMRLVAKLDSQLWEGSVGDKFYTPNKVQRFTTWVYLAGKPCMSWFPPKETCFACSPMRRLPTPV